MESHKGALGARHTHMGAEADKAVLTIKGYEALKEVADGKATKIFLPNELGKLGGVASAIAESIKKEE